MRCRHGLWGVCWIKLWCIFWFNHRSDMISCYIGPCFNCTRSCMLIYIYTYCYILIYTRSHTHVYTQARQNTLEFAVSFHYSVSSHGFLFENLIQLISKTPSQLCIGFSIDMTNDTFCCHEEIISYHISYDRIKVDYIFKLINLYRHIDPIQKHSKYDNVNKYNIKKWNWCLFK